MQTKNLKAFESKLKSVNSILSRRTQSSQKYRRKKHEILSKEIPEQLDLDNSMDYSSFIMKPKGSIGDQIDIIQESQIKTDKTCTPQVSLSNRSLHFDYVVSTRNQTKTKFFNKRLSQPCLGKSDYIRIENTMPLRNLKISYVNAPVYEFPVKFNCGTSMAD